jgi:hypothetical protein
MGKAVPAYQKSDSVTHAAWDFDALRLRLTHPTLNLQIGNRLLKGD